MKKETDRCEKLLKRGKSKTKLLFFDEWNDVSQWATTRWSVPPSPSPSLLRRAWSKRENRRVCPSKVPKPDFSSNISRKHILRTKMRKMCFLFLRFFWEKPWRKSGCASRMRRRSGKGSKSIFWTVRPAICGMEQSTIIRNPSSRFTSEGLPSQPAPSVRNGVLPRIQGDRQAGGCPRPFEYRNDAHLSYHQRSGAAAAARTVAVRVIKTESVFRKVNVNCE